MNYSIQNDLQFGEWWILSNPGNHLGIRHPTLRDALDEAMRRGIPLTNVHALSYHRALGSFCHGCNQLPDYIVGTRYWCIPCAEGR